MGACFNNNFWHSRVYRLSKRIDSVEKRIDDLKDGIKEIRQELKEIAGEVKELKELLYKVLEAEAKKEV
ncbi:coiled-coil domain-containing protein 22 [Aquifex aeolicus]|uniref:coiled-coil domain-containing protein 22 n=1 Tax=Aquifex aeolicus TaxID=63363 RepID=UPI0003014E80|nr:coiled-coil domain-containing protein 22 [Aquifex aeolicus]